MRLVSPPHPAIAEARRVVADPALCAASPSLASLAWLVLSSRAGERPRQAHRPAAILPAPTGGDAA